MLPALALAAVALAAPAAAQDRRPSHCIALVQDVPGMEVIHRASWTQPVETFGVRISYIDHAMFLIQTPGGLSAVTDYNGFLGPADHVPDVATMNNAHGTHWTARPDPRIPHVLTGWNPAGAGPVEHHLDLGEMLVRNVTTDIRGRFGDIPEADGNSVFVFEVEGLCIGHLGHLHHVPTPEQFAALGRLDVVMAPVDGGMTLTLPEMIDTLQRLRSSVVIPMHWFSLSGLQVFLAGMQDEFRIDVREDSHLEVSLRSLPSEPTVVVLRPRFLDLQ
jgi:hypothetical protein